jgi:hypothetical protein
LTVYVVHDIGPFGARDVQFQIRGSVGFTGVWVSETSPYTVVGASPSGISIGYSNCLTSSVPILEVAYTLLGTSSDCSALTVNPYPSNQPGILVIDCSFDTAYAAGSSLLINPTAACALAVEHTSWGKIKALYR